MSWADRWKQKGQLTQQREQDVRAGAQGAAETQARIDADPTGAAAAYNNFMAGGLRQPNASPSLPVSPDSRVGQPVAGRPGYVWQKNAKGEVVAVLANQDAATAAQVNTALTSLPNQPTGQQHIDPATGRPLGAPTPAPTTAQSVQTNLANANAQPAGNNPYQALGMTPGGAGYQASNPNATPPPAVNVPQPGAPGGQTGAGTENFVRADYSRYDQAAQDLQNARNTFQSELDRLSGVDPFGNQAFLQKATDRAVSQAAGTAAGARGGAAALAGANRTAQGVQAQTAARGIQEAEAQKVQDSRMASGLRLQAAGGIADVSQNLAQNEVALGDQAIKTAQVNLQSYLGGRELDARERESIRQLSVQLKQIDADLYRTDANYRAQWDQNLTALINGDKALQGVREQIAAGENISEGDLWMGLLGMGSGLAQAGIMASDRRAKFDIHDPDLRDLQDFLGNSKGKLYRYKEPHKPGRRGGLNYGPMAQDLAKSKIGKTLVVDDGSGTLKVDTGRLALADHAALAALAAEVEALKAGRK